VLVSLSRGWSVYLEEGVAIPWGRASLGPLRDLAVLCCQTLKNQGNPGAQVLLEAEGEPYYNFTELLGAIMRAPWHISDPPTKESVK
jgi:hypothetical protein